MATQPLPVVNTTAPCRKCGAPISADARDGVCPGCLFHLASATVSDGVSAGADEAPGLQRPALPSFGDFELLEEIARGGMGVVYKARQKSLDRLVAVKLILAGQFAGKQIAQRFKSEAIAAAVLQHPNIVAVHEVGVHDGQHFFSMDYVQGQNLAELVGQRPLPPRNAARYVKLIAEAIHYAHGQGILHRDLKPSNVLIDAATDQPRVTDFGVAKRLNEESGLTVTGQIFGSPHFMPPEQASGGRIKVGRASDVFGLGGILYFLLTARAPFQGQTVEATLQQVLHAEPVPPRLLNPTLPRDLETICLKCLQKAPERRYPSAQELADELDRFMQDEPIHARPVSRLEKVRRWCHRKPAIAALAAATTVLLLAVVVGSPIALYRIERARTEEASQRGLAQEAARRARRFLYTSDMNLAQQSLKQNNLGRARRLLDRHRPKEGEEDLRGWEWRYLWQQTRSSAWLTLTSRTTFGISTSFSPDGTQLAVGWGGGRVELWDIPNRRLVRVLTEGGQWSPGRATFSPVRNLLAATPEPGLVKLYDLDSGTESIFWRTPDRGEWSIRDLVFSQDGSKLIIYAGELANDAGVWVVDTASSGVESHFSTHPGRTYEQGTGAQLSSDNRRLYLARSDALRHQYRIVCIDLALGKELWKTDLERDEGVTSLALSPDGSLLASGSGFEDPTIRIWDTATGRNLHRLDRHTAWVCDLEFSRDGRRLISAGSDQSIRVWDTDTWTDTQVLLGHTDEVFDVAMSEAKHLLASVSKDGDLMLWREDEINPTPGYRRLPERLRSGDVHLLDRSRALLLPPGQPPELIDLKRNAPTLPLAEVGSSDNVLGCYGTNILCHWDGANQILVSELRGTEIVQTGTVPVNSGIRPAGFAYSPARQLLAWTDGTSSATVHLASLASPSRQIEVNNDVPRQFFLRFSDDGDYLAASPKEAGSLRIWKVETGQSVVSINQRFRFGIFAAGSPTFILSETSPSDGSIDHEILFYNLAHPDWTPHRVHGKFDLTDLASSPDGKLVASTSNSGYLELLDPIKGELVESIKGHMNGAHGVAFSPDGRRLITTSGGREAVKLWDVETRQELLTLPGIGGSLDKARWSVDGDSILVGPIWQAWTAPSLEEIEAREAKERPRSGNRELETGRPWHL